MAKKFKEGDFCFTPQDGFKQIKIRGDEYIEHGRSVYLADGRRSLLDQQEDVYPTLLTRMEAERLGYFFLKEIN